jgi:hypothetical protein
MGTRGAGDTVPGPGVGQVGQGGCSGVGNDGLLQVPRSAGLLTGSFISDIVDSTGNRQRNYTGELKDVFAALAPGDTGCAFEQHLAGIKRALSNPANAGFVRDGAYLGVIIIADEDDCSLEHSTLLAPGADSGPLGSQQSFRCTRFGVICDQGGQTPDAMNQVGIKNQCHPTDDTTYLASVADHVRFVKSLKPNDPGKIVVAGIMGTTEPFETEMRPPRTGAAPVPALAHSCTYIGADGLPEVADPPIRLKFFLDQFPNRSAFAPICQKDLSGSLQQIGDLLKTALPDPCITGKLADVDPATPGPQYDCSVSVVTNQGTDTQTENLMPVCPANIPATACWHLVVDAANCPQPELKPADRQNLLLKIENQDTLPKDAHILADCVTEVTNGTTTTTP